MTSELSPARIVDLARSNTGLDDFGGDEFREPLEVLTRSVAAEAGIDPARFPEIEATLAHHLANRLKIIEDRKRIPGIAAERIDKPLFILGLPRSGTTAMQALLAADPAARSPQHWELMNPSPPPETATYDSDPRIALAEGQLAAMTSRAPEMLTRHPFAARQPEECGHLFDMTMMNQGALGSYYAPAYLNWLLAQDYRQAYPLHRMFLQHLQHRHRRDHWVLKSNKHLFTLERLFETYPDLRLVWLHRDPAQTMPSLCSFIATTRRRLKPDLDPRQLGPEWTTMQEIALRRGLASRDRLGRERQICDVSYADMMHDPVGTVGKIHGFFGMAFDEAARAAVQRWVVENPQDKHGRHRYQPQDFGLDAGALRERFSFYTERFGVAAESQERAA